MRRELSFFALLVFAAVACCLASRADAQGTCYEYRAGRTNSGTGFTAWFKSPQAACAAGALPGATQACAGGGTWHYEYSYTGIVHPPGAPLWGVCEFQRRQVQDTGTCNLGGPVTVQEELQRQETSDCSPGPCNTSHPDVGKEFVVSTSVPATACHPITQCLMKRGPGVCIGESCIFKVTHTRESCVSVNDPPMENEPRGEKCIEEGEDEWCMSEQGDRNCGWLNGNFTCLSSVERDGCAVLADGSRVCGPDAPTPPAPDNGIPGQRAEPDVEVQVTHNNNQTTTNNYYNSTTVNNSARDPGMSGDNPYDGRDDGSGTGGTSGEDENPAEGYCPPGQTCDEAGENGEFGEVCTFGECASAFVGRIQSAPIVAAVLNAGAAMPSGACPNWTLSAFSEDYSLSGPMCDIFEEVSPILSGMFLIIWGWIATRIVLSA